MHWRETESTDTRSAKKETRSGEEQSVLALRRCATFKGAAPLQEIEAHRMVCTVPIIQYSNLILNIKPEPVTAEADATVYVWIFKYTVYFYLARNRTYTIASPPVMLGRLFKQRFRLFLGTEFKGL